MNLALSAAARMTVGSDSSADACIASQGVKPDKERRGTRRVGVRANSCHGTLEHERPEPLKFG
jgi:hypothetical protein